MMVNTRSGLGRVYASLLVGMLLCTITASQALAKPQVPAATAPAGTAETAATEAKVTEAELLKALKNSIDAANSTHEAAVEAVAKATKSFELLTEKALLYAQLSPRKRFRKKAKSAIEKTKKALRAAQEAVEKAKEATKALESAKSAVTADTEPANALKSAADEFLGKEKNYDSELAELDPTFATAVSLEDIASTAFSQHSCNKKLVICLTAGFEPFHDEEAPKRVDAGASVTIVVLDISEQKPDGHINFNVVVDHGSARDVLFEKTSSNEGLKGVGPTPFKAYVLHKHHVDFFVGADVSRSEITLQKRIGTASGKEKTIGFEIVHGRFFLQVGVLLPFVYNGQRSIVGAETGDGMRVTPYVSRDVAITGALSLTVIPWGRDKGRISSFDSCRGFGQGFGFQIAKDFNFSALGDWYLGGLFQPVTGVSLSVGWSLRQGEFLKDGARRTAVYENEASIPTDKRYMLVPYVGVTFTQEALEGLVNAVAGFKKLRDQP